MSDGEKLARRYSVTHLGEQIIQLCNSCRSGFLYVIAEQNLERESERAMREAEALEEELARAAAAAVASCPKTCAVCDKEAPLRCKGCHSRAYW